MFTIDKEEYELVFSQKRIELAENELDKPTLTILQKYAFSLKELKTYVGYGLKKVGAQAYLNPVKGKELAGRLVESEGYGPLATVVMEAIERDCGFFFQGV